MSHLRPTKLRLRHLRCDRHRHHRWIRLLRCGRQQIRREPPRSTGSRAPQTVHSERQRGRQPGLRLNPGGIRAEQHVRSPGRHQDEHVKRWLADGNFDVLHLHEPNAPSLSMLALNITEGPIVATFHTSTTKSLTLSVFEPILRPMHEKIVGRIAVSDLARR